MTLPPSPLRRPWRRLAAVGIAAGVLALAVAAPASAHVTVHADDPTRGTSDAVLAFRVPNERPNATTTRLEVAFPTATPLLGVLVAPHPGWTFAVTNTALKPPVKTDDGTITDAVSRVTWTANSPADAIPAGGYADFTVTAGQLPDTPTLTFKALQTYSSGEIVRWIDEEQPGQPEPDDPAPVLTLTAASSAPASAASADDQQTTARGSASSSDTTARVLGGLGIGLAVVFGAGGYLLGRRRPAKAGPTSPPQD
ncbi:YcnI family protein [Candidatus Frankia nodulisporulans]|uniref:YcnI family protein n=1 Tax=Candidatus Frankia nodulisporulans TaxID=2060052 RepID=UPI001CDCED20|nr:YcnI family protein [Candidatus Frankia nodulisporulans]